MNVVVLEPTDLAALHILSVGEVSALGRRHNAVGLRPRFDILHVLLAMLETRRFTRRQLSAAHTLLNACLLVGFTLIDYRRRLGEHRIAVMDSSAAKIILLFIILVS